MIKVIEIKGYGRFIVKSDLTHRPKCYLKLHIRIADFIRFKTVQFNSLVDDYIEERYQDGYDDNGELIQIKIIKKE